MAAVEKAEKLWADALEARKQADALSTEAEESITAVEGTSKNVTAEIKKGNIGPDQIANAQAVMDSGIKASTVLSDAQDAAEEADRIASLAEEALHASEKALEQHLVDFPENE